MVLNRLEALNQTISLATQVYTLHLVIILETCNGKVFMVVKAYCSWKRQKSEIENIRQQRSEKNTADDSAHRGIQFHFEAGIRYARLFKSWGGPIIGSQHCSSFILMAPNSHNSIMVVYVRVHGMCLCVRWSSLKKKGPPSIWALESRVFIILLHTVWAPKSERGEMRGEESRDGKI